MEHTVLFVDDEPNVVHGLRRALRREPYKLIEAGSAKDALRILANVPVDVIVADEQMPGMTGTELLAEVRERHPEVMRIILTGQASLETALHAINEGEVYRFLTKPCNHADLAVTVRHALQHKDLVSEAQRLIRTVDRQTAVLEQIERDNPGITKLRTTTDGAIVIDDDLPQDFEKFMQELHKRVEHAESVLTGPDQAGPA
jgi:two-component system probable response regulator PhcQ